MQKLNALRERLPDSARDTKLNLQTVLTTTTLAPEQAWGTALAVAYAARNKPLCDAIKADALESGVTPAVLEDAAAAASLMAMNNVFYRFRHAIEKEAYAEKPARLRMLRLNQPSSSKANLDLFSFAVSAVNFCQSCMNSHEAESIAHGLTEDQVFDAVRIAAVIHAAAVALEIADVQ